MPRVSVENPIVSLYQILPIIEPNAGKRLFLRGVILLYIRTLLLLTITPQDKQLRHGLVRMEERFELRQLGGQDIFQTQRIRVFSSANQDLATRRAHHILMSILKSCD